MPKQIPIGNEKFALVDDEDFDFLNQWKWHYGEGYARSRANAKLGSKVTMHRLILNAQPGVYVDHINLDKLDNRKENLRFCTYAENLRNKAKKAGGTSQYKGVYWVTQFQKWCCRVKLNGKPVFVKYFTDELEAAKAYNDAASKYHGEFARLNEFP